MTQQTAVGWFNQQLVDRQNGKGDSRSLDEIYEQAKQMEEEQHHNTWLDSRIENSDGYGYLGKEKTFEQYYNETYGKTDSN